MIFNEYMINKLSIVIRLWLSPLLKALQFQAYKTVLFHLNSKVLFLKRIIQLSLTVHCKIDKILKILNIDNKLTLRDNIIMYSNIREFGIKSWQFFFGKIDRS